MRENRQIRKWLYISVLSSFIYSGTILLMPLASDNSNSNNKVSIMIVGFVFWTFFILTYLSLFFAKKKAKNNKVKPESQNIGLLKFFSNRLATIVDCVLIMSVIAFIISLFLPYSLSWLVYIILSILVLTLNLHSIFNGKIYRISFRKQKRGDVVK